jgi:hypothetical protein
VHNTVTNLGASIGTALAGAVLISAHHVFLTGAAHNPNVLVHPVGAMLARQP